MLKKIFLSRTTSSEMPKFTQKFVYIVMILNCKNRNPPGLNWGPRRGSKFNNEMYCTMFKNILLKNHILYIQIIQWLLLAVLSEHCRKKYITRFSCLCIFFAMIATFIARILNLIFFWKLKLFSYLHKSSSNIKDAISCTSSCK